MSEPTVYAIASGKGGVGKTTLALNLGAALAAREQAVVVVDVDVGMANMATFLDLRDVGPTLHDVLAGSVGIQEATYEAPGGFGVVPGGSSLDGFGNVDMAALTDALEDLRTAFDVVLLDIGGGLSHDTALPLGVADAVLLVTTPDLASLENVWTTKELAERLDREVLGVVVTRSGSQFDLDVAVIEEELDERVLAVIPEDDAVRSSVHAGAPVVVDSPDAPASSVITGLAAVLDGDESTDLPVRSSGSVMDDLGETGIDETAGVGPEPEAAPSSGPIDDDDGTAEAPNPTAASAPEKSTTDGGLRGFFSKLIGR